MTADHRLWSMATNQKTTIAAKNSHVKATEVIMLAAEDAKTWDQMEVSLTVALDEGTQWRLVKGALDETHSGDW